MRFMSPESALLWYCEEPLWMGQTRIEGKFLRCIDSIE